MTKALVLATLLFVPPNGHAQVKQENWQRVLQADDNFETYKKDFLQFGQSSHARHSRNAEDLTDVALMVVADQTVSHIRSVETLVAVYFKVSSKRDRLVIWPLITGRVTEIIKRLDQQVEVTSTGMTQLRTPAVVAEATRMRDDLRQLTHDLGEALKEIEAQEAKLQ